ncbi:MAG: DNA recombination protein RmuC [Candidatus Omnitrophica bacterium]|nr:DNA recombination protein RmuC [Candidatus Omnitrophota bacterium]
MPTIILVIFAAAALLVFVAVFLVVLFYFRSLQKLRNEQDQQFLSARLDEYTQRVNQQLTDYFREFHEHIKYQNELLQKTQDKLGGRLEGTFGEVQNRLGHMEEAYRNLQAVSENINGWLESLRAPKLRGSMGELFLGDLLAQCLSPKQYSLQYSFKSGERVDAVIYFINGMVSIDSKFPLENFLRFVESNGDGEKKLHRRAFVQDVKRHVDNIAAKYIVPQEGTFDFALMYIPAENVYYESIIKDEHFGDDKSISSYALERRVIPVSPNSFYAYLQAIVLGLKGLKIESQAREILEKLQCLVADFERFSEDYRKIGTHIKNLVSGYEKTSRDLDRFGGKLLMAETHVAEPIIEEHTNVG